MRCFSDSAHLRASDGCRYKFSAPCGADWRHHDDERHFHSLADPNPRRGHSRDEQLVSDAARSGWCRRGRTSDPRRHHDPLRNRFPNAPDHQCVDPAQPSELFGVLPPFIYGRFFESDPCMHSGWKVDEGSPSCGFRTIGSCSQSTRSTRPCRAPWTRSLCCHGKPPVTRSWKPPAAVFSPYSIR